MNILFYISGHGYGHATRTRAIMDALSELDPTIHFYVKTPAPYSIFADMPPTILTFQSLAIDAGIVERDIITQDAQASLKKYAEINDQRQTIIAKERTFARKNNIAIIVSDIPPLASEIGEVAGIPVIACANFTWDFNYKPYTRQYPRYTALIDDIRSAYKKTSLLLKFPFHHTFDCFPRQQDIPLVARQPTAEPQKTRQKLGIEINDHRPIILVAFRTDVPIFQRVITNLALDNDIIVLTYGAPVEKNIKNVIAIGKDWQTWQFPDLLRVSTLVVSKIGYSTLAECIAARTRLVYPPRENYPEYDLLHHGAREHLPSLLIPKNDFLGGNWLPYIKQCLSDQRSYPTMPTNGAQVAGEIIYQYARRNK